MTKDGFVKFSMHANDTASQGLMKALVAERVTSSQFAMQTNALVPMQSLDPETAARQYLKQALGSLNVPQLTAPRVNGLDSEFKSLGTKSLLSANVRIVKFRQLCNKIPVYGSLITVELDGDNELVSIDSNLGKPSNVNSIAQISPQESLRIVARTAGESDELSRSVPVLNYYYYDDGERWHLVYIVRDVPVQRDKGAKQSKLPIIMDYLVDAHSGEMVERLPRTANAVAVPPSVEEAKDGLGVLREIRVAVQGRKLLLKDENLNVETYDFEFQDVNKAHLPGRFVTKPPDPWDRSGVSAHANAAVVAEFLRDVLGRNGVDDQGSALVSSINCVDPSDSTDGKQWPNAAWVRTQMVYGQVLESDGTFRSFSVGLDVVAHEIYHGVTDRSCRLEYAKQSGALNESFSDIFGILISNRNEADIGKWNWEMGEDLDKKGTPLRELSNPEKYKQPAHMSDYAYQPNTVYGDWGGVHTNSGIPNFAAYKIMTAKDDAGKYLFDIKSLAALFHYALTERLSPTSRFADCRNAMVLSAQTLFRSDPTKVYDAKVKAVRDAYIAVGIK
jgi:Zn-dependent metalloprotease